MTHELNTPELTKWALDQLNPMTCPVRVYDDIIHAYWGAVVRDIMKDAEREGWTR